MSALESFIWLIIVMLTMILLKRWIHRHVQAVGLLLTRDSDYSFLFYSLLLLPGTVVHESAHFLVAQFLGVRVRKFSVTPAKQRRFIQFGFVEIDPTSVAREALIGLAPLLAGSIVVLLLAPPGLAPLQSSVSLSSQLAELLRSLPRALNAPDLWLLLYLIFAISNGMLPSESDRRAWIPMLSWFVLIATLLYLSGLISTIPEPISAGIALGVRWIVRAFVLTCLVDLFFMPIIFVLEKCLEVLTRRHVEY